jgi:hypothetical protein
VNAAKTDSGIDGGRVVVALGAILLLVSLFLDWYGFGRSPDGHGFSAWTAFELVDLILAVLAIAAIAAALEPHARSTSRLPEATGAVAGPVALILVAVSLINLPPAAQGFDSEIEIGAWLGLAGAAIMCAGALLALNRVSLVVTPRERTRTPATPARPADETETRPL